MFNVLIRVQGGSCKLALISFLLVLCCVTLMICLEQSLTDFLQSSLDLALRSFIPLNTLFLVAVRFREKPIKQEGAH